MFSDSSSDYWFFGVCNKRTAFCPWRNKGTTVFRCFGGCVTRELLLSAFNTTQTNSKMLKPLKNGDLSDIIRDGLLRTHFCVNKEIPYERYHKRRKLDQH